MQSGYTAIVKNRADRIVLRIVEWPEGFYVFYFKNDSQVSFRDELQESLEIAKLAGEENYGIKADEWVVEDWERELR